MRVIIAISHSVQKKLVKKFLNSMDEVEQTWWPDNYSELKQIGLKGKIDLLVTDLKLGGEKGYEFIKELKQQNKRMIVVFYTSFSFLQKDFETNLRRFESVDLVVLQEMGLEWLCSLIFSQAKRRNKQICLPQKVLVTSDETSFFLNPEDIIFIEKVNKQLVFHSSGGTLSTNGTLTKLEEKLPDYFYRSHRSYLINFYKIKRIIPYGRSYQVEFIETDQKAILSYDRQKELSEYCFEA